MSDANKDDALKCLNIARKAREDGNLEKARKFAEKAKQLYPCAEVDNLLRTVQSVGGSSSRTSSAQPQAGPSLRSRATGRTATSSSKEDTGTPAQQDLVKKIKGAKGDYYGVLSIPRSASDEDIKKAYRKLALKLHPDKCRAPGAEEAFKEVSKAFSCLTDPQKRAFYDRTGHEDMAAASAARSSRGMHAEEINPEEIFNAFFGNMMFGMGPMGMGQQFRQAHTFRPRPRQQQQQHAQGAPGLSGLINLLPLLVLLLVTFMSHSSAPPVSLHNSREFQDVVYSSYRQVPFYVRNERQFEERYPMGGMERRKLEQQIEIEYRNELMDKCRHEATREQQYKRAWARRGERQPQEVPKPNCDRLNKFLEVDRSQSGYVY